MRCRVISWLHASVTCFQDYIRRLERGETFAEKASYSEQVGQLISDQLHRFSLLNQVQLAGHLPNLDFWMSEAKHAIDVINGYGARLQKIKAGRLPFDPDRKLSALARRVPTEQLQSARRQVVDEAYHFLRRLYHVNLIDKSTFRTQCDFIGTSIDVADLGR